MKRPDRCMPAWLLAAAISLLGTACEEAPPLGVEPWSLAGESITSCSCRPVCPCRRNGRPTPKRFCERAEFAAIERGRYGDTVLDGVKFFVTAHLFDPEEDGWAVLYIDQETTPAQRDALRALLQSLGLFPRFSAVIAAPVRFAKEDNGRRWSAEIRGAIELRVSREHPIGKTAKDGVRGFDLWSETVYPATNIVNYFNDRRVSRTWNWSGRYAVVGRFDTSKADVDSGRVGWGRWDGSGRDPFGGIR